MILDKERAIEESMRRLPRFLVRLLHKIDKAVQRAFTAIFNQVCRAHATPFAINKIIISSLYAEIDKIFVRVSLFEIADFYLPIELNQDSSQSTQAGRGSAAAASTLGKRSRGDTTDTPTVVKSWKQKEGAPDAWRMPES